MAKEKRKAKESNKDEKDRERIDKIVSGEVILPPLEHGPGEVLWRPIPPLTSGFVGGIGSIGPYYVLPIEDMSVITPRSSLRYGTASAPLTISPEDILSVSPKQDRLEHEIAELRKENRRLAGEIATKTLSEQEEKKEIAGLKKNIEELSKKQRLQHLIYRVNEGARVKLLESEDFRQQFEKAETCSAIVMSVDIRRSTELMLKAREPHLYADFIISLCSDLTKIILDNFGIFDKFTGDGILAFFPDFYTGDDVAYWSLKAADECHSCFSRHYQAKRNCFISILVDVGLGIGIDYGDSHLVSVQDGLTVIGAPVVYACRFSGCEAGRTVLNQPAYEVTSKKFGEYVNFQECELDIKHEGRTLAYLASLTKRKYNPSVPNWAKPQESPKEADNST